MASIRFYVGVDMNFFSQTGTLFRDSIAGGMLTSSGSDYYRIYEGAWGRDTFYGTGLGSTSQNMPTTGTVTEWAYEVDSGGGAYSLVWDFSGFSVSAASFSASVLGDDVDTLLSSNIMAGDDWVYGSGQNDVLLGYGGNDSMIGGAGNDVLDGGSGVDDMVGGAGDDTYVLDNNGDRVSEVAGEGHDSVDIRFAPEFGTYVLGDNVEDLRNESGSGLILAGNALDNDLYGAIGFADALYGGGGNDYLSGGTGGGDAMYGGDGNDVFIVDSSTDIVSDAWDEGGTPGSGTDEVRSSVTFSLSAPGHADIENIRLTGSAAINATGNALANTLSGNSAANVLNGGGGADIMRGGDGNDTYFVNSGGDVVLETSAGGGIDTVRSSVSFTLGANVENLQLGGANPATGIGNGLANHISGNNQANLLFGYGGDDSLSGNGGNDAVYGGAGDDILNGGAGEDWIEGGAGRDKMTGGSGAADVFVFRDGDFAGLTGGTCDVITDFNHGDSDEIRLNSIDANVTNAAGTNDAFSFIGSSGFHHVAGELRYQQIGGNAYIYGDTDGDGQADFMIRVAGQHMFTSSDFVL